ncbi:MAG: hypothetical protein U5Q44_04265 [Dehalococcoidia bacterium]|nr:hypothetical protein [Dehalococcoidia bacterium]
MLTEHGMNIDRESLDHVLANADVLTIALPPSAAAPHRHAPG